MSAQKKCKTIPSKSKIEEDLSKKQWRKCSGKEIQEKFLVGVWKNHSKDEKEQTQCTAQTNQGTKKLF